MLNAVFFQHPDTSAYQPVAALGGSSTRRTYSPEQSQSFSPKIVLDAEIVPRQLPAIASSWKQ